MSDQQKPTEPTPEPLPDCPFCGLPAEDYELVFGQHSFYRIGCPDLHCRGFCLNLYVDRAQGRNHWSKRPPTGGK